MSAPVHGIGTPVMAYDFWGVSPLYENEDQGRQNTNCDSD